MTRTFRVSMSQFYEFQQEFEIEAESEEAARATALEEFECNWEHSHHLADETEVDIEEVKDAKGGEFGALDLCACGCGVWDGSGVCADCKAKS